VDANVLFSALIVNGKTAELLMSDELELFIPELILAEFAKYKTYLIGKSHRSETDFYDMLDVFCRKTHVVSERSLEPFLVQGKKISPDKDDVHYFAAALLHNCAIWSNDKQLKQQVVVEVLSTEDLIRRLNFFV
jgi:predicted nucleic acid-binding protein